MTFATPSTPGTDFPITQHDSAAAGDCPQQATIGVGEGRLSHSEHELDEGLDFFAVQGARDRERLGRG
jgi:hypothetical protein